MGPTRVAGPVEPASLTVGPVPPAPPAPPSPYSGLGYLRRSGMTVTDRFRHEGPGLRPNSIYSLWGVLLFTPAVYFWSMIAMFAVFFAAAAIGGAAPEATAVMVLPATLLVIRWFTRPLSRREREIVSAARRGR